MSGPTPASAPPRGGAQRIVRIVLFAILGLAIAALGYDQLLARPRNEDEFAKVQKLVETKNLNPASKPITNKDVRDLIGRDPSRTVEKDFYAMEFYTWPRGLPINSYYICVVYAPKNGMLLHEVKLNEMPDPDRLPGGRLIPEGTNTSGEPAGRPMGLSVTTEDGGGAEGGAGRQRPEAEGGEGSAETPSSEQPSSEQPSSEQPAAEEPAAEEPADTPEPAAPEEKPSEG